MQEIYKKEFTSIYILLYETGSIKITAWCACTANNYPLLRNRSHYVLSLKFQSKWRGSEDRKIMLFKLNK